MEDGCSRKRTMQLLAPRRTHTWARTYQMRAQRLIDEGRMHQVGLDGIQMAKDLGLWDAHASVDDLEIPSDLHVALIAKPEVLNTFQNFPPSYRRNVLRWMAKAKMEITRTKRINEIVERTSRQERIAHLCTICYERSG